MRITPAAVTSCGRRRCRPRDRGVGLPATVSGRGGDRWDGSGCHHRGYDPQRPRGEHVAVQRGGERGRRVQRPTRPRIGSAPARRTVRAPTATCPLPRSRRRARLAVRAGLVEDRRARVAVETDDREPPSCSRSARAGCWPRGHAGGASAPLRRREPPKASVGRAPGPRDEDGGAGCLGRTCCSAEVLRVRDPVEHDDDRVVGERERPEVALPQLAPGVGVVAQSRDDALVIGRQAIELRAVGLDDVDPRRAVAASATARSPWVSRDAGATTTSRDAPRRGWPRRRRAPAPDGRSSPSSQRREREAADAVARETQALRAAWPSPTRARRDVQGAGERQAHLVAPRLDRRTIAEDGDIARGGHEPAVVAHQRDDTLSSSARRSLRPPGRYRGSADRIAQRRRPKSASATA